MKCGVCGNGSEFCLEPKKKVRGFCIQLRSSYEVCMNVPCFARQVVNDATGDVLPVETEDGDVYVFDLKRRSSRTFIFGDEYKKFLKEYDMRAYDKVFFSVNKGESVMEITPESKEGFVKERVKDPFVFEDEAIAVVFSKGVDPSGAEIARINNAALDNGISFGAIFLRKLTPSDVEQNMLHIPKSIVSVLDVNSSGKAKMMMGGENGVDVEVKYFTTRDGRWRFRTGWDDFVTKNRLDTGDLLLFMFHLHNDDLQISDDLI